MTVFRSAATDFRITGEHALYATARGTGTYSNDGDSLRVGQSFSSGLYFVYRSFLSFNTAAIPDGDTVSAAVLGLRVAAKYGTLGVIYVYKYKYIQVLDSYTTDANRDKVYDVGTTGATDSQAAVKDSPEVDCTSLAVGAWAIFTGVDTTWINKTGVTQFALRCKRDADGSGTAPAGQEYYNFNSGDDGTSAYQPYLDLTHGTVTGARITRLYAQGVLSPTPFNQLG